MTGTRSTLEGEALIGLKHGAGSRAMRELIRRVFAEGYDPTAIDGIGLDKMDDGAAFRLGDRWLVLTTDSHVIHPLIFPGGDIGRLAVSGTVNDLAMMGATEILGLTSSFILEEGFPLEELELIQASLLATSRKAGAPIVTGDTKVMGRGEIDRVVINTSGVALTDRVVPDDALRPGDRLVVTGTVGDHGLAILATRNELELFGDLRSDVAPLNGLIGEALGACGDDIVVMKDPTRGGLASALFEMATKSNVGIVLDEPAVPVTDQVRAAGELLGIDPLCVANEGKAVIGVRPGAVDALMEALHAHELGRDAAVIGLCSEERPGSVILDTGFGRRLLAELDGEPMPRIC